MTGSTVDNGLWVRRFHPGRQGTTRLVCFPHAGSSASFYYPVSTAVSSVAEVLILQYPGRQDRRREPCIDTIEALAEEVTTVLLPWADRELVFFGHSMGAILAFEVACRLQDRHGIVPRRLVVSGRRAPSTVREERVHTLDDDGIVAELKSLSGTDQSLLGDEEFLRMVMPAIRSDYRAIETYQHTGTTRVKCPITVLTGDRDPKVTLDEAAAWKDHTTIDHEMKVFAGGHFFITGHATEINRMLSAFSV